MPRTPLRLALALLLAGSAADACAQDPEAELQALESRRRAATELQERRYAQARTDAELERLSREAPWAGLLTDYERFAREHAGTDVAVAAWAGAIELSVRADRTAVAIEGLEELERAHLASPRLALAIGALADSSWSLPTNRFEVFLRRAAQESPHRAVKGFALFTLADNLARAEQRVEAARDGGAQPVALLSDERAKRKREAAALLRLVLKDFADTPSPNPRLSRDWVERRAAGALYELEHLQVGMPAPDFEATDEQGRSWKLSDYRGRVVLLDFWGNW